MFSNLILPVALISMTPLVPPSAAPALRDDGIELVARTTSTRFAALNPSDHALVLVFVDTESGANASLVLPAGGDVEYRIPDGVATHLELEVFSIDNGQLFASGAIALARICAPDVDALWIKRCPDSIAPFAQVGSEFQEIDVDHHVLRADLSRGELGDPCPSVHVPVITPSSCRLPDTPPKLEKYVPAL